MTWILWRPPSRFHLGWTQRSFVDTGTSGHLKGYGGHQGGALEALGSWKPTWLPGASPCPGVQSGVIVTIS